MSWEWGCLIGMIYITKVWAVKGGVKMFRIFMYTIGGIAAIANSLKAWDGELNSAVVGWAVATMLFTSHLLSCIIERMNE